MRKTRFILKFGVLAIILHFMLTSQSKAQLPSNDPDYELVWYDNFNTPQLDTSKWNKTFPWHQGSNYNTAFCGQNGWVVPVAAVKAWRDANWNLDTTDCKINNGTLKLITRKENYLGPVWNWPNGIWTISYLPFKFTTAMLYSKWDFRYGYFEIQFKLPPVPASPKNLQGHGATFWLWSGDYGNYSEIDGFEINGYDPNLQQYYIAGGNSHYAAGSGQPNSDFHSYNNITPNTWHTMGINWTSHSIEYYIDNALQFTSYNHPDSLSPMALIITCGGNYAPVDNYCEPFDTSATGTYFPFIYEINYVKIWQPKKDCNTDITLANFNPTTYSNKLHKSITMGTNISITNQSNQSFWGQDYILMNNQTYIDENSNVSFNVTDCNNISYIRKRSLIIAEPMPKEFLYRLLMHY